MFVIGLLAMAISWNRRMLEEVLLRMRRESIQRQSAEQTQARITSISPRSRETRRVKVA
jgi:hypothetical protein